MGGKEFNGIKTLYVKGLACVRVKGCESKCSRIDSGVRQVCIMSPLPFNVYMDAVMKDLKRGMGERRGGVRFQEASCMIWREKKRSRIRAIQLDSL